MLRYIPAHFCLLGKVSVPLRSVQSRRPPDVLHPNPLELLINRRATLTLYHKITFSSLNLPHKDTLLPQVFFSETLFVHYASFLFLQYKNYCSQVPIKIRKSPNHNGLSFICAFTFSIFWYRISVVKYRIFVRFCQVLVLNVYSSFSFPAILPTYSQPVHTKTADHLHYQPKSFL